MLANRRNRFAVKEPEQEKALYELKQQANEVGFYELILRIKTHKSFLQFHLSYIRIEFSSFPVNSKMFHDETKK